MTPHRYHSSNLSLIALEAMQLLVLTENKKQCSSYFLIGHALWFPARFLHDQLGAEVKPRVRKIESYDQFTETYHVKT